MRFIDLDPLAFEGATILLDIDGTLVSDKGDVLDVEVVEKVRALSLVADVHLASNGDVVRSMRFATELGISTLPQLSKPRRHSSLDTLVQRDRVVVIGDKLLTDRLWAHRLRAEYVAVDRLRADTDTRHIRATYIIDDLADFFAAGTLLLRPHQWIKNLLVFAPLFFAGALFAPNAIAMSFIAFISFCIAAGAVYVLNDLLDQEQDRQHPRKQHRPIASGRVSSKQAYGMLILLTALEASVLYLQPILISVIFAYVMLNILYSIRLKHVAVVDILCVSVFYLLRLEAGSLATAIPLSPWIVLCVFFVSLFVIVGKRRAEYVHENRRLVLEEYSKEGLDAMLSLTGGLAIISYALYTVIGRKEAYLLYSTIFVAVALLRVLNDIHSGNSRAEAPEKLLFKDPWILAAFAGWAMYLFIIFYRV